jgi:TRAP-type C4-dicarboxylate transport system permease small subunit
MIEPKHHALPLRLLAIAGGGALLLAMATDAIGVIGRQTGIPLVGAIEIVQAAILISGSAALLVATIAKAHATVHILIERLSEPTRAMIARVTRVCSSIFFMFVLAGSIWLAIEAWPGFEASEVLGIPYEPLRVISCLAVAAVIVVLLWQAISRRRS